MGLVATLVGVAGATATIASGAAQASATNKANYANNMTGINQMLLQLAQDKKTAKNNVGLSAAARGAALDGPYVPDALKGTEHAVLPYFTGGTEARAGRDAAALYEAGRVNPSTTMADYSALVRKYAPLVAASDRTAGSLVDGTITDEMLADAKPVFETRMGVANNSAMDALAKTLADNDRILSGRGFSGDGSGNQMVKFNAYKRMGEGVGMASLQNETERQAIKNAGRQLRIQNIGIPDQLTTAAINRKSLPAVGAASDFNSRLQPFGFFKMNPNNAPTVQSTQITLPRVQPNIPVGAAVASGIGTALPQLYSTYAKNRMTQAGSGDFTDPGSLVRSNDDPLVSGRF